MSRSLDQTAYSVNDESGTGQWEMVVQLSVTSCESRRDLCSILNQHFIINNLACTCCSVHSLSLQADSCWGTRKKSMWDRRLKRDLWNLKLSNGKVQATETKSWRWLDVKASREPRFSFYAFLNLKKAQLPKHFYWCRYFCGILQATWDLAELHKGTSALLLARSLSYETKANALTSWKLLSILAFHNKCTQRNYFKHHWLAKSL